jgi:hypothetical protein
MIRLAQSGAADLSGASEASRCQVVASTCDLPPRHRRYPEAMDPPPGPRAVSGTQTVIPKAARAPYARSQNSAGLNLPLT